MSSYSPDRGPRSGTAVTPYREAQREIEERREQPAAPASSQGFGQTPQTRRVQAANAGGDSLPARPQDLKYQAALSSRAAQAIASYSSTATFVSESDAPQVLGLDLYA
ncbi:hypothetical protein HP532_25925 [Pseudomonas sp. CrR25]|nr:hypothetical protein [Pseudomonas sp. CrR25]